ncbi:MAG TPA: hypothetical protein VK850_04055 [Candidatus Binatia bacterium]|nr:hypothetical protein [Candidatus Binatia bacterium]
MKKAGRKKRSSRVVSRIEFLRMQMASAESILKEAKENFGRAKRRRKLAKLLAKRAKTDVKHSKEQLTKIREAVALAETKAITQTRPVVRRRVREPAPMRAASKPPVSAHKKASKGVRLIRTAAPAETVPQSTPVLAIIRQADEPMTQTGPVIPDGNGQN